jgi:polysaccharide deacetylase 2 family uncharacterized protein YibQ
VVGGFIKGVLLGAVVAVGGAVGLSLISGGPVMRGLDRTPPDVASAPIRLETPPDGQGSVSVPAKGVDAPVEMAKPGAPAQTSEPDGVPVPDLASDAGQVPETGGAQVAMTAPQESEQVPAGVHAAGDTPVAAPLGEPVVPAAPEAEASPDVYVQPAAKPAPGDAPELAAPEGVTEISPDARKQRALEELLIKVSPEAPEAPAAPGMAPDQPEPAAAPKPAVEAEAELGEPEISAQAEAEPEVQPESDDMTTDPVHQAEAAEPVPPAPTGPVVRVMPEPKRVQIGTPATRLGTPAQSLGESTDGSDEGATSGGFKMVGVAKPSAELPRVTAGAPGKTPEAAAKDDSVPPLQRFAAPAQDTGGKPEMSIVLIDDGTGPVGVEALAGFPYPLSIAVDTSRADAEDTMATYRAAGFEVLAMVRMPQGAQPEDVEQAMPVLMAKVPEAVAVMEAPDLGIQFDRKVSDQVTRILADTGQGLLLYPNGFDTARKLATKSGVPAATVFRDLDAEGQDARAIRRFLNFGTVKAGNGDGAGVVMVGRMRADTLSALILWALEDKTRQVAIVPLSQQLLGE